MITYEVVTGGFKENPAVFEEFKLAEKGRFEALQGEPTFDGWMVKSGLLEHVKEVENLVTHLLVLDDFVPKQGSGEVLRREAYNQLIMREFLDE